MENELINYYDGTSARTTHVRVLAFNEKFYVYQLDSDDLIASYPVKGSHYNTAAGRLFLYFNSAGTAYIEMSSGHPLSASFTQEVGYANDSFIKKIARQKILVLAATMIAFIIGMYMLVVNLVPLIGSALITKETERRIGDQLHQAMMSEERLIGATIDSAGTRKLQAFADKLKLSNEYPLRFTLVKSKVVNAYALPGGQIVVYTGMLGKIKNPEALVALLAHEATHVNERHSLRSMLRSAADAIIISVIFGDASGVAATLVGHAGTLRGLDYSRSIETEADELGMQLMLQNGVNVAGMKELMEILNMEGDVPESISFLSSHPLTTKRIAAAEKFIKNHPSQKQSNSDLEKSFKALIEHR